MFRSDLQRPLVAPQRLQRDLIAFRRPPQYQIPAFEPYQIHQELQYQLAYMDLNSTPRPQPLNLLNLPAEIILQIFQSLPLLSTLNFALTSRPLLRLIQRHPLRLLYLPQTTLTIPHAPLYRTDPFLPLEIVDTWSEIRLNHTEVLQGFLPLRFYKQRTIEIVEQGAMMHCTHCGWVDSIVDASSLWSKKMLRHAQMEAVRQGVVFFSKQMAYDWVAFKAVVLYADWMEELVKVGVLNKADLKGKGVREMMSMLSTDVGRRQLMPWYFT